jgi:hypothetical protein
VCVIGILVGDPHLDPALFRRASIRLSVDPIEMSKPVTGPEFRITNQQAAQTSVSGQAGMGIMKVGKIGGSPDHHKLSDHSEPESIGLSQDLFHKIK